MSGRAGRRADGPTDRRRVLSVSLLELFGPFPQDELLWSPIMVFEGPFIFCCAVGDGMLGLWSRHLGTDE